jgi:hypothetical protein
MGWGADAVIFNDARYNGDPALEILAEISFKDAMVAEIIYRTGFHVEVRVAEDFQADHIGFSLSHSRIGRLEGTWESALDTYFNEACFDSKDTVFRGELRRVGSAREHKSLFRQAIRSLLKDLEPHGYQVKVSYS